jgi:hypothetical protein
VALRAEPLLYPSPRSGHRRVGMSHTKAGIRRDSDRFAQRHYDSLVSENKALKEKVEKLEKVWF